MTALATRLADRLRNRRSFDEPAALEQRAGADQDGEVGALTAPAEPARTQ